MLSASGSPPRTACVGVIPSISVFLDEIEAGELEEAFLLRSGRHEERVGPAHLPRRGWRSRGRWRAGRRRPAVDGQRQDGR